MNEKRKKLLLNILKLAVAFASFELSPLLKLLPITIFKLNVNKISTTTNYILSIYTYICLVIILFLMYRKELKIEWQRFKNHFAKNMDTAFKYYFIGLLGMMFFNIIINFVLKLGGPQNEKNVQSMIHSSLFLMLICAGLFAPIVEELIFRKSFKNVFSNKWVFVIISGLIFGGLHVIDYTFQNQLEILYILPYGILGGTFAYMDYEVDSVFPSITMHMLHNILLTILSILV